MRGRKGFHYPHTLAVLLLAILLPACVQWNVKRDWQPMIQGVQNKYAPDPRLAVFRAEVHSTAGRVIVTGEVEDPAAKKELLWLVEFSKERGTRPVIDEIRPLPDPALGSRTLGLVNLSVGNVRRGPDHPAELVTQVFLGDVVALLKKQGSWYYIHCPDRYLGWIDEEAILLADAAAVKGWDSSDLYRVVRQFDLLRSQPKADAAPVCDLTAGDLVRREAEKGAWLAVSLPDGRSGFVESTSVMNNERWRESRRLTPDNIETVARGLMGVPYLWGGTSAKGFDCSGFVKTVFFLNGTSLNRDADQQARQGEEVAAGPDYRNLRRGDLLFFGRRATAVKPEQIVHVGVYLNDRKFIHCSGRVRINSLDPAAPDYDAWHVKNYIRARRFVAP